MLVGVEARPVAREAVAREAVDLRGLGRQRREVAEVAGEGVEEADGGVRVALQEAAALGGVEDAVVGEQWDYDISYHPSNQIFNSSVLLHHIRESNDDTPAEEIVSCCHVSKLLMMR